MKKLIYEIKLESNKLSQKTDEELNQVIQQVKKEFNIRILYNQKYLNIIKNKKKKE